MVFGIKRRSPRSNKLRAFSVEAEAGRRKKKEKRLVSNKTLKALTVKPSRVKRLGKAVRSVGKASTGPTARKGARKVFRSAKGVSNELFGKPRGAPRRRRR